MAMTLLCSYYSPPRIQKVSGCSSCRRCGSNGCSSSSSSSSSSSCCCCYTFHYRIRLGFSMAITFYYV